MVLGARNAGLTRLLLPLDNANEAALVDGLEIYAVASLSDAVATLRGYGEKFRWSGERTAFRARPEALGDFADVRGQATAKRALEIAAAGGHNVLLVGPPGCGKTMLARRLPSILPPMSIEEALEVTKIYSVAGLLSNNAGIVGARPFRAPHHTISQAALAGGGSIPHPGEISLAHHGVLFLDEAAEFNRAALEVMRQPLEEGYVTVGRAAGTFTYPARFALVASMNPCPCGFRGTRTHDCRCDDAAVARYVDKLSGPLLDRIDVHVEVGSVAFEEMLSKRTGEPSASIRRRVEAARARQQERYAGTGVFANAGVPGSDVRHYCAFEDDAAVLFRSAAARGHLSARALDRISRVARTIADLDSSANIEPQHVAEAIGYRAFNTRLAA